MNLASVGAVNLVVGVLVALVQVAAIVCSALLARGPARWLAPLGFGLLLFEQVLLLALVPALGAGPLVAVVAGLVLVVPAAICLGLAIVLGYRAAVRPSGSYGPAPTVRPGTEPPPGF